MLIRFEASNYRSILDSVELSLVAVDRDRREARDAPLLGESLLAVAAIFGPNASGKSNILAAISWVVDALRNSLRAWDSEVPIEPFAFGDGPAMPSEFAIDLLVRGVRFEYVVEVDRQSVRYEGLFHYPEKKRRRIFEREGDDLKLQRGLGAISGTRELLTESTLALSAARRFEEPLVTDFAEQLLRVQTLGHNTVASGSGADYFQARRSPRSTMRWFGDSANPNQPALFGPDSDVSGLGSDREQALALLKLADLGIDDVVIDSEIAKFRDSDEPWRFNRKRVRLVHRTGEQRIPLDFTAESEGTRTWFHIIGPILTALRGGSVLLFDELDASLHPTLSAQLIRLFLDPTTNPRGAQLIFTSHDTSLLNHLNRDEVWLTEKTAVGATRLGALAEFAGERVRKSVNLENAYLHGRFGALPDVDETDLLRTLGLIG